MSGYVHQWTSLIHGKNKHKRGYKHNRVVLWSVNYRSFDEFNTPDMEIVENEKILDTDNFAKIVMKKQTKKTISCCIKFPSSRQEGECIKKIKKKCSVKKCKKE